MIDTEKTTKTGRRVLDLRQPLPPKKKVDDPAPFQLKVMPTEAGRGVFAFIPSFALVRRNGINVFPIQSIIDQAAAWVLIADEVEETTATIFVDIVPTIEEGQPGYVDDWWAGNQDDMRWQFALIANSLPIKASSIPIGRIVSGKITRQYHTGVIDSYAVALDSNVSYSDGKARRSLSYQHVGHNALFSKVPATPLRAGVLEFAGWNNANPTFFPASVATPEGRARYKIVTRCVLTKLGPGEGETIDEIAPAYISIDDLYVAFISRLVAENSVTIQYKDHAGDNKTATVIKAEIPAGD